MNNECMDAVGKFIYTRLDANQVNLRKIADLYYEYLNYGDGILPHLSRVFELPDTIAFKCTEADNGKVIGIVIYTNGIEFSCGHMELVERIHGLTKHTEDDAFYTGEGFLVTHEGRRHHISDKLLTLARDEIAAKARSAGHPIWVVHELWVHPDGWTPALRCVTDTYGVTYDLGIHERFYKEFHHYGYLCPICKGECVCSAHITLSKISEEATAHDEQDKPERDETN